MARNRRLLSPEERELWDNIRRSVTPLKNSLPLEEWLGQSADGSPPKPATAPPKPLRLAEKPAPSAPMPAFLPPYVPPVSRPGSNGPSGFDTRTVRKLRKGRLDIDARIDLHGMRERLAHDELLRFIRSARDGGARIVLVITGKGRLGEGVLRRAVPFWFAETPFRHLVGGYRSAHAEHGGEGAIYVRIRRDKAKGDTAP